MDQPVARVEILIEAPPERVWAAMTAEASPMFMGARMETDWRPGSGYTLRGAWNGNAFTDYGTIETAAPGKELSFTHWSRTPQPPETYNAVSYRLEPVGASTRVTLSQFQRGKAKALDDKTRDEFRKTWTIMLEGLKRAIEG
ncbi:MAG TPA: SRPBCC domain-containing protein [Devosia sp.]|nr:SRPBCC domain-containing protein [Devosia sp.]